MSTFTELIEEASARGLGYLKDGSTKEKRLKRWINDAYREICDLETTWAFLEETKEGKAPLTIEDAAHVLSFVDVTNGNKLEPADRRTLVTEDPKLSATGQADSWYREGLKTYKVYPADTSATFSVRYEKAPKELSAGSDEPIIPTSYQELIVDGTMVRGLKDQNNYEAAQFVRQEWKMGISRMVRALGQPNYDENLTIQRTGYPSDYQ